MTGDLGRIDATGHLQLFGRKKNMIVTEGGKNIYPEDIETAFEGLPVKEFCVFAANYIWPRRTRDEPASGWSSCCAWSPGRSSPPALRRSSNARNRRLPDFKRVSGYLLWDRGLSRAPPR